MPLTLAAYARHRGCARNAVARAIEDGRLSRSLTRDRKIRSAREADAEWEAATIADQAPDPAPSALVQARSRLGAAKAELIEMQLRERKGELVQAADVERRWAAIITGCKAQLLAIPSRLKQEDPDLTTAQVALVERLVREALIELGSSRGSTGRRSAR